MLLGYTVSTLGQQDKTNIFIFTEDQLQVVALEKHITHSPLKVEKYFGASCKKR